MQPTLICSFPHISHDPSDSCSCVYHLIPISHCFVEQLTSAFISPVLAQNLSNQFSVRDFCNNFMLKIACVREGWVFGLTFTWSWSALTANFSLCCLALLILSGKPEHKCGESSFILMSQVLDLLKSEYWNGLELGTFKGFASVLLVVQIWGGKMSFSPQTQC